MTPWTVAHQAPLSMVFPRQEYWSGFPFLSPGDLPDPGIKPASLVSPAFATYVLGSFNGPEPGGNRVDNKNVKERKRLISPGLRRGPIKPWTQDLHHSRKHQAPSRGAEGTKCLLERVLEARAGK